VRFHSSKMMAEAQQDRLAYVLGAAVPVRSSNDLSLVSGLCDTRRSLKKCQAFSDQPSTFFGERRVRGDLRFCWNRENVQHVLRTVAALSSGVSSKLISETDEWKKLHEHKLIFYRTHSPAVRKGINMRDNLKDKERTDAFVVEHEGVVFDYTRQRMMPETLDLLLDLAKAAGLEEKVKNMFAGKHINATENRAVMHMALRSDPTDSYKVDGHNVVDDVHKALARVKAFAEKVRSGEFRGATGKKLTDTVCVGIGGSYLATKFVYEALRQDEEAKHGTDSVAPNRKLRFYANVDPTEFIRCIVEGTSGKTLDPETTLVIVISKTFTTAETMLNAKVMKRWFNNAGIEDISRHMVAVSSNFERCIQFGIKADNVFDMWDWVGGRYSVTSAVGVLPLSIQYGYPVMEKFLAGARNIDQHFLNTTHRNNLPVLMGLIGVWNATFLAKQTRAILPYQQALLKLAPHIQQLAMESNGKGVSIDGRKLDFECGQIEFGEPGTDGQHSFYQLLHQGRVVPSEFIGFCKSQVPIELPGEPVSNHDELMSNFFAQPDVMALGKTKEELEAEGVPPNMINHKFFSGNRPSTILLFPDTLNAYALGQLLALYEHRTAVEGFIWGVNSFDQWGVELGKVLGVKVRAQIQKSRTEGAPVTAFCGPTNRLMERYLKLSSQ